jgi:hypothetical protein
MLYYNVKVKYDQNAINKDFQHALDRTQYALDTQILKDSNYFIPMDTSYLMNSSLRASDIGGGLLRWDTPYARRLYYNPQYNFQKDENPNARGLWFEEAKARWASSWERIAQQTFDENF